MIPLVGTHVVTGSELGAEIQLAASSMVVSDSVGNCFSCDLCAGLSIMFPLCGGSRACNKIEASESRIHLACSFLGGDPKNSLPCEPSKWTTERVEKFLQSEASVVWYRLEEVPEVLRRMGFLEAAAGLDKLNACRACAPAGGWAMALGGRGRVPLRAALLWGFEPSDLQLPMPRRCPARLVWPDLLRHLRQAPTPGNVKPPATD
ncbi:unnamed protein product, partial [Effrenium voratum]